jgi:hypothetical protein
MLRRLWMLAAAGVASVAVGIPAGSGRPVVVAGSVVPLIVPPAQSVAMEAVTMRIPGSIRPSLTLGGVGFAPGATAIVAVKTASSGGSTAITLLAVTVSRETRTTRATPLPFRVSNVEDSTFLLEAASTSKPDTILRITVPRGSAGGLVDTGKTTPARGPAFQRAVQQLLAGWNPLAKPELLKDAGIQIRLYDSKHPGGQPIRPARAIQAVESTKQLLQGPTISVRDDIYRQIDETSGCILGRVACGKYVFAFKGLRETIIRSDDNGYHLTTHYSGKTCGRTPLGQPWRITAQSGSGPPRTYTVDLAKSNIVFTTHATVAGKDAGSAIHKIAPQPGAFPLMEALVDSTGVWSSDAGGQTVPVSVTKLTAGKSC